MPQQVFIFQDEVLHHHAAIFTETLFQVFRSGLDFGKVEAEHHIFILPSGGVLTEVQAAEKLVEAVGIVDAIVCLKHGEKQGLAEAARTDEEKIGRLALHQFDVSGLVHIVIILATDARKIGDAIGNCFHDDLLLGFYRQI